MAVTFEERQVHGWLGRTPREILGASREIVHEYKDLSKDARDVALMSRSDLKIKKAKDIEQRYYELLDRAKRESK